MNAKHLLKLVPLAALVVAGCNGFTSTPTGTPTVVRAIAAGGNSEQAGSVANQKDIQVDDAPLDATFFVWFDVGLDGSTVQGAPDIDPATGKPSLGFPTDSPDSPLATKSFTPPGGTAGPLPAIAATGTVATVGVQAGDTVKVGSTTFTAGGNWPIVAGDDAGNAAALTVAINGGLSTLVTAAVDPGSTTVNLTAVTPGPKGNTIALGAKAPSLITSGPTLDGGAGTSIAYQPGSASDGGLIYMTPPTFWDVGAYVIGGTVRDISGTPGTFQTTFNVTHKPVFVNADPYTLDVGWANDPRATGYTIQIIDVSTGSGTTVVATNVQFDFPGAAGSTGTNEIFRIKSLVPGHTYRATVLPEGITGTTAASTPNDIDLAGQPGLKAVGNPILSGFPDGKPGTVQLSFGRIRSANYHVQTTDTPSDAASWTDVAAANMKNAADDTSVSATGDVINASATNPQVINIINVAVTGGTTGHSYRVVPDWDAGTGVVTPGKGLPTKTATVLVK